MSGKFTYQFDTATYKGSTTINTGLFINGKWVEGSGGTIECVHLPELSTASFVDARCSVVNPSTGKLITKISEGTKDDVDRVSKEPCMLDSSPYRKFLGRGSCPPSLQHLLGT